jgi:peptidoglycan hydrolase-like protein with peptidoglycan-binding domain
VVPVVPGPGTPALQEAGMGLTLAQRREIQLHLTRLGFDTRGADGAWGPNTRAAISRWQQANRLAVTGYLTAPQVDQIARQIAALPPPQPPAPTAPEAAERALNLSAPERREVQLRLTLLGHSTQGTNGTFGPLTRRAISEWQRAQRLDATGYLTAEQVRLLQRQTGG